jgi:hypothetical protein
MPESFMRRSVCAVRVRGRELLAPAADDRTVRVWDPATGRQATQIPTGAVALAVVPFGTRSLFIGLDSGVLAVDLADPAARDRRL